MKKYVVELEVPDYTSLYDVEAAMGNAAEDLDGTALVMLADDDE